MATIAKGLTHISQRGRLLAERETPAIKNDESPAHFIFLNSKRQTGIRKVLISLMTAVNQTYLSKSETSATSELSIFPFQHGEVFFLLIDKKAMKYNVNN